MVRWSAAQARTCSAAAATPSSAAIFIGRRLAIAVRLITCRDHRHMAWSGRRGCGRARLPGPKFRGMRQLAIERDRCPAVAAPFRPPALQISKFQSRLWVTSDVRARTVRVRPLEDRERMPQSPHRPSERAALSVILATRLLERIYDVNSLSTVPRLSTVNGAARPSKASSSAEPSPDGIHACTAAAMSWASPWRSVLKTP